MVKRSLSINAIRSKYSEEKRISDKDNLWGSLVLRRISYYPTWLFLRLGVSANEVTGISLIIGCVGCIFLASGNYDNTIIGVLLINMWALFDYVDGNVARYNDSCSKYGEFLDAFDGIVVSELLFLSAGIGVFRYPDSSLNSLIRFFSLVVTVDKSAFLVLGALSSLLISLRARVLCTFGGLFSLKPMGFLTQNIKLTKSPSISTSYLEKWAPIV